MLTAVLSDAQTPSIYTAFVVGSGYTAPPLTFVAPGQVVTFFVGGLPQTPSGLAKLVAVVTTEGTSQPAPVLSAKPFDPVTLAITVQIPFAGIPVTSGFFQTGPTSSALAIQFAETDKPQGDLCAEGACSAPLSLSATFAIPHIISTCDIFYSGAATPGQCLSAIAHQTGALVTVNSPAKPGEILTAWALGLGVPTGGLPASANGPVEMNDITPQLFFATKIASIAIGPNNPYLFAGLPSPAVGLYQINFAVPQPPSDLPLCTPPSNDGFTNNSNGFLGNMTISIGREGSGWFAGGVVGAEGLGAVCVVPN